MAARGGRVAIPLIAAVEAVAKKEFKGIIAEKIVEIGGGGGGRSGSAAGADFHGSVAQKKRAFHVKAVALRFQTQVAAFDSRVAARVNAVAVRVRRQLSAREREAGFALLGLQMRAVAACEYAQVAAFDPQRRRAQPVPGLTDHGQRSLAGNGDLASGDDGRVLVVRVFGAPQVADGAAAARGQRQAQIPARRQRRGRGTGKLRPVPDQFHIFRLHGKAAFGHRSREAIAAAFHDGDPLAVYLHARAGCNARVGKYDLRLRQRRAAPKEQAQRAQRRQMLFHIVHTSGMFFCYHVIS